MKQPNAFASLFGNPFMFFMLGFITVITGIMALNVQGWGLPALLMLGIMGYSTASNRRVIAYRKWQREWEAMSGKPPRQPTSVSVRWLRWPIGIAAWLCAAAWTLTNHDGGIGWAVGLFWIGSLFGWASLLLRIVKRAKRAMPQREMVVAVCPRVPMQSASVSQIYGALPNHCVQLFLPRP
ncbi:MAG: hypothetical protein QM647_08850 [Asticcacaulis sp.]|uniref:hypothetical protein n=1 Tax=Asticcacaulis sp. TaxID=1872648 RepID=UPI0039E387BF